MHADKTEYRIVTNGHTFRIQSRYRTGAIHLSTDKGCGDKDSCTCEWEWEFVPGAWGADHETKEEVNTALDELKAQMRIEELPWAPVE